MLVKGARSRCMLVEMSRTTTMQGFIDLTIAGREEPTLVKF